MSYLIFTDTETTGLDPIVNEVLSIGIQVCDAATFEVVAAREWYIKPERIETASPEGLKVNGYTPEKWAAAGERPGVEVFAEVLPWLQRGVFAGHNCPFDIDFIWQGAKRLGLDFGPKPTEFIDTRRLSELPYNAKLIRNNKLDSLVELFGFSRQGFHGALEDADLSRRSAQKIFEKYADDVFAHVGRGGEAIAKLAQLGNEARARAEEERQKYLEGVDKMHQEYDEQCATVQAGTTIDGVFVPDVSPALQSAEAASKELCSSGDADIGG